MGVRSWLEEILTEAGTCDACGHETFTEDCDCTDGRCTCFQERHPGRIWCSTCAFAPQLDDPQIYEKFGKPPLQYRDEWFDHVRDLHMKHDGAHEPNWHPDD